MFAWLVVLMMLAVGVGSASALTVTASDFQSPNKPENVVDRSYNTRWSCQGECWLQLDFGYVNNYFRELWISWRNSKKRISVFDVAVSVDGATWETVFSGTSDDDAGDDFHDDGLFEFGGPFPARYVRVIGHGNDFNDWNSILDIHLGDFWEDRWEKRDIKEVTASHHEKTNAPALALDSNLGTHWTADSPAWIQFEFARATMIEEVDIAWKSGNKRVASFDIQVSEDGSNWETAFSGQSSGASLALESYMLNERPYCAKYVRIVGKGNNDPKQKIKNSITEVEIWTLFFPGEDPDCDDAPWNEDSLDVIADRQ